MPVLQATGPQTYRAYFPFSSARHKYDVSRAGLVPSLFPAKKLPPFGFSHPAADLMPSDAAYVACP